MTSKDYVAPAVPAALQRPSSSSQAPAVRSYFTAILHQFHGVSESEAGRIAAAWKLGRGAELATYDLQTFRDIFGSEAGMLLYTYARGSHGKERERERTAMGTRSQQHLRTMFGVEPGFVLVEFLFLAMVYFGLTALRDYNPAQAVSLIEPLKGNAFIFMVAFVVSYIFYFNIFSIDRQRS